jgi:hypothetical protein
MGKHKITLINVVDTRRYLSGLINRVENGSIDSKEAGRLTYISNTLLKAQELECIEKRLVRLEEVAERREAIDVTPRKPQLKEGKS